MLDCRASKKRISGDWLGVIFTAHPFCGHVSVCMSLYVCVYVCVCVRVHVCVCTC